MNITNTEEAPKVQNAEQIPEAIVKKLEALFQMANPENGATENEILNATALAHKLMDKYRITADEVQSYTVGGQTFTEHAFELSGKKRAPSIWQRLLLSTLADFNFCKTYYKKAIHVCILVGKESNVQLVMSMFEALQPYVAARAVIAFAEMRGKNDEQSDANKGRGATWQDSYRIGFAHGLHAKLQAERDAAASETSQALVVVADAAISDWYQAKHQVKPKHSTYRVRHDSAAARGFHDGRNAALTTNAPALTEKGA
jgi:hypothetical protein